MSKGDKGGKKDEDKLRRAVVETAREMSRLGLSSGRSGNVSARLGEGMLITPTAMAYSDMDDKDIVRVEGDGTVSEKSRHRPSSEWRFHLAAYRARPDLAALVHTHSPNATVLACARRSIPPFHYMVAAAGGRDIPVVPYAAFGTDALAQHVARGLAERRACLMEHHGQIAGGESLGEALELAIEVEHLAGMYVKLLALGPAPILTDVQMDEVLARFAAYRDGTLS